MSEFKALDEIPSSNIELIRVLSPLAGTTQYGTNAAGGVILVTTRNGT
jgi:outer membrane receptor protein involved in Fe transport